MIVNQQRKSDYYAYNTIKKSIECIMSKYILDNAFGKVEVIMFFLYVTFFKANNLIYQIIFFLAKYITIFYLALYYIRETAIL